LYTRWTTLQQERDQTVPKFTNVFHTLRTKMVIKYSEKQKCSSTMVVCIDTSRHKWIFWPSFPWVWPIDMLSKSSRILNKINDSLDLVTPHNRSRERVAPTHKTKGKEKMESLRMTILSRKQRRTMETQRKTLGSGTTSIRAPGITLLIATQSSHWWRR
jgi:hypothetical protein